MKLCDDENCQEPRYAKHRHCKYHRNLIRRNEYVPSPAKAPCHCGESHHAKGLCKLHYLESWRRDKGIPERPPAKPKPVRKKRVPKATVPKVKGQRGRKPKLDVVGYRAAHRRVERVKGKASTHHCVRCGNPAQEWALKPDAPELHYDERDRPYSLDVEMYMPMCCPDHRLLDKDADDWYVDVWLVMSGRV